ncbi:MAG: type IV toxin-antitoxin system AbiEi family antitoxin [Bacteroidales bacterium]|nr:type IV toxin-antitoxin system AbiEi family antitoxin [Bacteroidales bacterium]
MKEKSTYNYIDNYLRERQAKGVYSVTLGELRNHFSVSEKAILQNIYRLKRKHYLAQVRKEFYVIIPPQYSNRGMIPPTLFIDDMMRFLKRVYYVGFFSAAALQGAGHQQPMELQVVTKKPPLRNIKNEKLHISYYTKTNLPSDLIIEKKTQSGYLKVSSPELTAIDLVRFHKRIGGLNRIMPILEDLTEIMKPSLLSKSAKTQNTPTIQRLGYLLDILGNESLVNSLNRVIGEKPKEVPLSLTHKGKTSSVNKRWKIIENITIDL